MTPVYALTILIVVFALGEIVAEYTKAIISTTLAIAVVLLIAFWCGLPADIVDVSAVTAIGMNLIGILIAGIGTLMDFTALKRQWKTVVISLAGVVCGVGAILLVAPPIVGRVLAFAGAPIYAGANVATLIMVSAMKEKGLAELSSFCVLVLVTQNFVGIPIASYLMRKEAKCFIQNSHNVARYAAPEDAGAAHTARRRPLSMPGVFSKPLCILAKLALVSCVSFYVSRLTGGKVHYFVVSLLMGIVFAELGFLEKNALSKTDSGGFILFATTIVIFANFAQTTPAMLAGMIAPLVACLTIGTVGVVLSGLICARLFRVSPYFAVTMGLTCTFGFPTTLLMSREVGHSIGRNAQEREAITNYLMPNLVTAGFVTVTITSVFLAGFVATLL